jgi:adenylate cyclase
MNAEQNKELWYQIFAMGHPDLVAFQNFHRRLPSPPRCKLCLAPFKGVGSWLMTFKGKTPSSRNPRYCSACDKFLRAYPGGAEVEMSMIFVDVRGSSALAEQLTPSQYGRSMNVFYRAVTSVLYDTDGFIIDLVGDEVVGLYPPGFSGKQHAQKAIRAAKMLLELTIPVMGTSTELQFGIGVNTGIAYIGTVTGVEAGLEDVRALGDQVNVTSRLASIATGGEALLSETTVQLSGATADLSECRELSLKGRNATFPVRVLRRKHQPAG